ncbi:MAG: hypothetical protein IPH11_16580 [Ignavibacteriales bacterium]|nr:hypothetical protein [Ignavibacteriales bacterium]
MSNNYINASPSEYDGTGIYSGGFTSAYYPIIDSNYIITNGDGIRKSFGSSPTISNNVIILNDETDDNGISLSYSDSAKVFNNFIISISGVDNGGISNLEVQNLRAYNNYVIGNYRYNAFQIGYQNIAKNNVITNCESEWNFLMG